MWMRRSLGGWIVQGGIFANSTKLNYASSYTTLLAKRINASYAFPRVFNSFHFPPGYNESKHYHSGGETKGGSDLGKEAVRRSITIGDTINLPDLFFTKNRDYLIKSNKQHVKAEQLEGKVIGIYFLRLSCNDPESSKWHTGLLKDIYTDLQPVNNFEVVLVAYNDLDANSNAHIPVHHSLQIDPPKHFEETFSCMPWTAIPFSDVTSRKHIQQSFGLREPWFSPRLFIVDPTGMVLQCVPWDIFSDFGALGYPFSDERIKFLMAEDDAVARQPSLKTLLSSPNRDYVISNKGDKVPIHTLEDKVVALYFYHPDLDVSLCEELKWVYEELAKMKKIFEVVLVYIREPFSRKDWKSEESFWEKFKTMPWLALPFGDLCYKKLRRVFEFACEDFGAPSLVIFGPHADYIEPFGRVFLRNYSIPAYPFTRKKAAELEFEKVKELKLEMLWDPKTVFRRNDGSQVPFSQLSGKRVILVFDVGDDVTKECSFSHRLDTKFLTMLKERYLQMKGSDDEFEVIRILINSKESSITKRVVGDMPWLVSFASELMQDLGSSYFWYDLDSNYVLKFCLPIFAFDLDGRLVRKTMYPTVEDLNFPFYAGGLEEEILSQLVTIFQLRYWDLPKKGRIYSWAELNSNMRTQKVV